MGWRDSYAVLLELFPQVDSRLIKGAALEHGSDVAAAAEFILSDVLGDDEGNSMPAVVRHWTDTVQDWEDSDRSPHGTQSRVVEEQALAGSRIDDLMEEQKQNGLSSIFSDVLRNPLPQEGFAPVSLVTEVCKAEAQGFDEEVLKESSNDDPLPPMARVIKVSQGDGHEVTDAAARGCRSVLYIEFLDAATSAMSSTQEVNPVELLDKSLRFLVIRPSIPLVHRCGQRIDTEEMDDSDDDDMDLLMDKIAFPCGSTMKLHPVTPKDSDVLRAREMKQNRRLRDAILKAASPFMRRCCPKYDDTDSKIDDDEFPVCDGSVGALRSFSDGDDDVETSEDSREKSVIVTTPYGWRREPLPVMPQNIVDILDDESLRNSGPRASFVPRKLEGGRAEEVLAGHDTSLRVDDVGLIEDDEYPVSTLGSSDRDDDVAPLDGAGLESMLSIQKSAISEEMDRADWENLNSSAVIQLDHMEPLDNLVKEAKAEKEALINSIEEIRLLRLATDHAERAARQSREEAVRGGADVMAQVAEIRKIVSRAAEANAVQAGEVFGEKAVLATEARELQYRLTQVNNEKAKAVAALNEIKASLQARIESAVLERAAYEEEKVVKELQAKEALAKEEALVSKVAQESRDLEAEAAACSKILDFLIERGFIVDALQGEVAVLREDAETLKKDLESMSLSYSSSCGLQMPMLSQAGSAIFNSVVSVSGGKVSELDGQPDSAQVQMEVRSPSSPSGSNAGSRSPHSVSALKTSVEKKMQASLPSLLRAVSGSMVDLNSSGLSVYSSLASNSLSSSREALSASLSEKGQFTNLENFMDDMKYPSSPNSPASPAVAQEERELLKAKMAMFPGEEQDMEYSGGVHNLDVFRAEKQNISSDEDWQLLEKNSSRSSSLTSEVEK